MQENDYTPLDFIKEIHKKKVKYLLIGRRAVIAYGGPMQTMDYDIYAENDEKNIALLLKVAEKFDLTPSIPKEKIPEVFKFKLENDFTVDIFTFKYFSAGDGKKISFQEIYKRRNVARSPSGFEVNLPSIDDLIALKKIRNSLKDREDIRYLEKIKEHDKERGEKN